MGQIVRTREKGRAIFLFVAGLTVASVVPGGAIVAQGGLASYTNPYCIGTRPTTNEVANGSTQSTCTYVDANSKVRGTASTYSSASNGVLRAASSLDRSNISIGSRGLGSQVGAFAEWRDKLVVTATSGIPTFARFLFTWNGQLEAVNGGFASASFVYQVGGRDTRVQSHSAGEGYVPSLTVAESFSLTAPLVQAGTEYRTSIYMKFFANALYDGPNSSLDVRSSFANSGGISSVELLAENGTVLTTASYRFDNGLELYRPTTVPEPATLALVVPGLLGTVFLRRRRRMRAGA